MLCDEVRRERIARLWRIQRTRSQSNRATDQRVRCDQVPSEMLGGDDVNRARQPCVTQVEGKLGGRRRGCRLGFGALERFFVEPPLVVRNSFSACHFFLPRSRLRYCPGRGLSTAARPKLIDRKCDLRLS